MSIELFPLRVATGKRFCNRTEEKSFLKDCIDQKRPVVIISPRRYGKTSLANKVVEELSYPFCSIDFLTAYDDYSICQNIIKGVSELISQIMPINVKTINLIEKCFKGIRATVRFKEVELEFTSAIEKNDPVRQVLETLKGLESLAHKLDKSVVILMDEFQSVLSSPKSDAIQGSIRHVAQMAKHVAFLFSGSSRHILAKAFEDPNFPLYMMCEKLNLERIEPEEYYSYIQEAALIKWKKSIENMIIKRILDITENHSFYVNFLCGKLWQANHPPSEEKEVDKAWYECLLSEERRLISELDALSLNQRLTLKAISHTLDLKEPTSTAFLNQLGLSSGSVTPILKSLTKKDLIFIDKKGCVRVLDPLLKYMLVHALP